MASLDSHSKKQAKPHVCSIIPPNLAPETPKIHLNECRAVVASGGPANAQGLTAGSGGGQSIIPSYVFQAIADSDEASSEQKDHA